MNATIQRISIGDEKAIIIPEKVWAKMMSMMEEAEDILAYDRAKARDTGERVSIADVEKRLKSRRHHSASK